MSTNQQASSTLWALPKLLATATFLMVSAGLPAQAQSDASTAAAAPLTRAQVKMERNEFVKTHRWEPTSEMWVLKPGFEPPEGVKSRTEVKAERDAYLSKYRWDERSSDWVPVAGGSRKLSTLTRAQVKAETIQFMRTHEWDEESSSWVAVKKATK